jgi:dihydroorotate dehydrogenase (NAD+) catalytic subunit
MLNSIGLENVGVDAFIRDKMPFLRSVGCVVLVNVFGFTDEEYVEVVQKLNDCEGIAGYELNISCPNTECGGMVFGTNPILTTQLTRRVKDISRRPLIVKLSPNVTDIVELAKAAVEGGADALSVANTYLGMAIDVETFKPRIHTVTGGLSGPAIKPITLRMVFQITKALPIPVIALGGITTGADAVEYFLAGATAVQVGTANFHDPRAPINVLKQLRQFLERRKIPSIRNLIGRLQT